MTQAPQTVSNMSTRNFAVSAMEKSMISPPLSSVNSEECASSRRRAVLKNPSTYMGSLQHGGGDFQFFSGNKLFRSTHYEEPSVLAPEQLFYIFTTL